MRKLYIVSLIFVFGFAFCLTNGFADKVAGFADEAAGFADEAAGFADDDFIPVGDFVFPTADGAAYIQDTPEFQKAPENIIGTNDFEKMRDLPPESQDYQLGRKVGFFLVPTRFDPNRSWICTGFLVGPDLFMTNHHCIHDDFGPLPLGGAMIFMDYYQERNVDRTLGGVTARVAGVIRMDAAKDYALLRLDKPIGNTYGWLDLDSTTRVNSNQSVKLISHNQGRSKEIVRRNSQIVDLHPDLKNEYPFLLAYLADSEPGSSGSPVFLREGTGVIAIHHSGWTNRNTGQPVFNAGSLMSYIVPEIQQYLPNNTVPDLVVEAPRVSKDSLLPGETFTLSATVRNQGAAAASSTTLRFYESVDSNITTSDPLITSVSVSSLGPSQTSEVSETFTAPASEGTYYYGACVDAVANETVTDNNCSTGIRVTVSTTPPVYMYWTDWETDKIQRATLDGTNVTDFIVGLPNPHGIAVDVERRHIYWIDTTEDSIQRANLDGSNVRTLVTGLDFPLNLALDVAGGHIYWTDYRTVSIQRANLDGSNVRTLVTGLRGPTGLALDVADRKMYWTDWDRTTDRIQRANLDGSNVQTLIPTGSGLLVPESIALDVAGRKMYWTDSNTNRIQRANLDGTRVETLISVDTPVGFALDIAGGKMYWTTQDPGRIQRANLNGSNVQTLVTGLENPYSIVLGIPPITGPSPSLTFNPSTIPDQTFKVGTPVSLILPIATGGTAPYIYIIRPNLPAGLQYDNTTRVLSGTPTTATPRNTYTYTARDAKGVSGTLTFTITVTEGDADNLDVNGDGQVNVLDLILVAVFYGTRGDGLPADVNADGIVNVDDFAAVAAGVDAAGALPLQAVEAALLAAAAQAGDIEAVAGAPIGFATQRHAWSRQVAYRNVAAAFADVRLLAANDPRLGKGIALLAELLQLLKEMNAIPETTALLPNYPNPFNPETWIPYHLAQDAAVTLTIYNVQGDVVRQLMLGHQSAGVYESRGRAASWDGRNRIGEPVASGLYFYTLTAGDFTATRKLLIAK